MEKNNGLDLSLMPKELNMLLEIISEKPCGNVYSFSQELTAETDWDLFLQLAMHHRIYPLIYSKLRHIDQQFIPSSVIQALQQSYKENTYWMLNLCGEMERLSRLFAENNIQSLNLKGPAIADAIYGDISLRTSKDLDILIPKSELKKAKELLVNSGYILEDVPAGFDKPIWRRHHVSYFHIQKGIQVELHWRLYASPAKEPSLNELWERRRVSSLTNYPVHFFGEEDLLLYLIVHGAKHGWLRLRWLADIDKALRKKDTPFVVKDQHQSALVGQALLLASELFKTPIDKELIPITNEKKSKNLADLAIFYIVEAGHVAISQSSKEVLGKHDKHRPLSIRSEIKRAILLNYYKFAVKTDIQKGLFIILLLYPTTTDARTLRLPKSLYLLYFPLRLVLPAWRKVRKVTATLKSKN